MMKRKTRKKSLSEKVGYFITIFLSICGALYVLYVGRSLILPPHVAFENIKDGTAFEYPLVILDGTTKRTRSININGYAIQLSPEGTFTHDILLSPGVNTLIVDLEDPFGLKKRQILKLFCRLPCQPYVPPSTTKKSDISSVDAPPETDDTIPITNTNSN